MFSQPGTTIVEVHCMDHAQLRLTFRLLSLKLGFRYHGTVSTQPATSERCADDGVVADAQEIRQLFEYFVKSNLLTAGVN